MDQLHSKKYKTRHEKCNDYGFPHDYFPPLQTKKKPEFLCHSAVKRSSLVTNTDATARVVASGPSAPVAGGTSLCEAK
jgi:hypothetical protein